MIYGLVDPAEPHRVRYVGQTVNAPSRLAQHIATSIPPREPQVKVQRWVAGLHAAGRYPDLVLLEYIEDRTEATNREREWILTFLGRGQADRNGTIPCATFGVGGIGSARPRLERGP